MVTIEADEAVWRYLTVRKTPGDSFNDVLRRELGLDADADRTAVEGPADAARQALADWDPADVDSAKARQATVAVVDWLASADGPRQKGDVLAFAEAEGETVTSGYAASTLWEKVVQPGLRELVDEGLLTHQRNVGYEIADE